jgi:hypothetical protein
MLCRGMCTWWVYTMVLGLEVSKEVQCQLPGGKRKGYRHWCVWRWEGYHIVLLFWIPPLESERASGFFGRACLLSLLGFLFIVT